MESLTFCAVLAFCFAKATEDPFKDFFSRALFGVPILSDASEDLRLRGVPGERVEFILALAMSPDFALGRCIRKEAGPRALGEDDSDEDESDAVA
jgi:hypothetical protein